MLLIILNLLSWILIGLGCWLGWQLLRQNGRMLLRLDELEQRLEKLESSEAGDNEVTQAVAEGTEAKQSDAISTAVNGDAESRATRFANRSLSRSKIKRDGLKAGTTAPAFHLPRLDGGELSLAELQGTRVLLVFSDPHCGPCNTLEPELEKFHRAQTDLRLVMISCGEPGENRRKAKEHGLTFPILLQQRWEVSRLYAMFATPIAYLIDEEGTVLEDVALGVEPIRALMSKAAQLARDEEPHSMLDNQL